MLGYALRCLKERPALWAPSLVLALLAALPGALAATVLAPAATAFLLTADVAVAGALLPGPLAGNELMPWVVVATAAASLAAIWVRALLVAVWCSDERKEASLTAAWRGTRGGWAIAFALHLEAHALVVLIAVLLVGVAAVMAPAAIAGLATSAVVVVALVARAVVRVALTLAVRAAALDGARHRESWRRARHVLGERKHDAVAGWIALLAAGVALWIGGRLVTPVLQDTALAYGHGSAATALREAAHILFAVPLEAFLVALSAGLWTAVYLGGDALKERRITARPGIDPWLRRALIALVLLVVVGNGIPTAVERRVEDDRKTARRAISADEIHPEDALRSASGARAGSDYRVVAALDGNRLEWSTTIRWRNDTGEPVDDVGVHIYPNAFTRKLEDIPLALDVLQSPAVRRRARPATLDVTSVAVSGTAVADFSLSDTALLVPLRRPLAADDTTELEIELVADLPRFPDRYGSWDDVTLLGNWIPVVATRDAGAWRFDEYGSVGDPFVAETASYDVSLALDRHLAAVGTGALVSVEDDHDGRVWRFYADGVRDAAFAVSPVWRGLEGRVGDTIVRAWFPADESLVGAHLADAAESAVAHYRRRFGDLPFDEIEVVQTNGILGGMEYPGVVFVSRAGATLEGFPLLPELLEHAGFDDAARRYIVGHEVAHQWWYASVGNDQVREPWLDEALAELSTRLWLRAEDGDDRAWVMTNLATAPHPRPGVVSAAIGDFADTASYSEGVYREGSQVLLRLRAEIGTARLYEVLRAWHERGRGRIGTVDEFIETVHDVAGTSAARSIRRFR